MFTAESIPDLIHLLEKRNVHLYHACQYQDFCAYLALGGIPSRQRMEKNHRSLTPFTTDANDKENGVWDKVFFNLDDFGRTFAMGGEATPNTYGPIMFKFKSTALTEAIDVAICLRSAGTKGFKREEEALPSMTEINDLFFYPPDHPKAYYLKYKDELQKLFGDKAQSVEMSCMLPKGILSFKALVDIVVDPYLFDGIELSSFVLDKAQMAGLADFVKSRRPKVDAELYNYLLLAAGKDCLSPSAFAKITPSAFQKEWATKIEKPGSLRLKNYYRYLQYLYEGSVLPVKQELTNHKPHVKVDSYAIYEDYDEYDDEYDDVLSEEALLDFEDDTLNDEFHLFLEEWDDDAMSWAESEDSGWFYGYEDDIYDDIHSTLRRF